MLEGLDIIFYRYISATFIAVLFRIVRKWKQSLPDECLMKMWYIYTMKFYSAGKKSEILNFAGKWNQKRLYQMKCKCCLLCLCLINRGFIMGTLHFFGD